MSVPPFDPRDVVLAVLLVHACWTDLRTQKIKNYMTLPVMAAGVVLSAVFAPQAGGHALDGVGGWIVALLLTIPAWAFGRALNAGDVKMLAAAGALMGPEMTVRAVLFTFVLGLPAGLLVLALKGRLRNLHTFWVKGDRSQATVVAHAPVVALGILLARLQPWPDLWE